MAIPKLPLVYAFWQTFGSTRFTYQDIYKQHWRRAGCYPTHEDIDSMNREIRVCGEDLELAMGPRGGKGWRVTAAAIATIEVKVSCMNKQAGKLIATIDANFHSCFGKVEADNYSCGLVCRFAFRESRISL